ncbi:MAG: hypothetical protein MZW92_14125 [Comamonadaceae bacterium]|nr:hypothetical protein [Comamonadaceae bacterium]
MVSADNRHAQEHRAITRRRSAAAAPAGAENTDGSPHTEITSPTVVFPTAPAHRTPRRAARGRRVGRARSGGRGAHATQRSAQAGRARPVQPVEPRRRAGDQRRRDGRAGAERGARVGRRSPRSESTGIGEINKAARRGTPRSSRVRREPEGTRRAACARRSRSPRAPGPDGQAPVGSASRV